tara:strand:- start:265 stop:531 length:267 start_codon:yes stop_codon:yes gene_type:complete
MEMTKQLMFEQFNKLETNSEKAEYLTKIKEEKQQNPSAFRNIKINLKQYSNMIKEYQSVTPFSEMFRVIEEREARERSKEMAEKKERN